MHTIFVQVFLNILYIIRVKAGHMEGFPHLNQADILCYSNIIFYSALLIKCVYGFAMRVFSMLVFTLIPSCHGCSRWRRSASLANLYMFKRKQDKQRKMKCLTTLTKGKEQCDIKFEYQCLSAVSLQPLKMATGYMYNYCQLSLKTCILSEIFSFKKPI